jgi:hypothetical protein
MRTTRSAPPVLLLLAVALAGGGSACSKHKDGGSGAPPVPGAPASGTPASHLSGTPRTDKVIDTLKGTGLRADGFTVLDPPPFGAGFCEQGRIEGIDTLVCEFADNDALDRGKKLLRDSWEREGVHTGVTTAALRTLLAVADRAHHDPNGKTINQILTAFKKI